MNKNPATRFYTLLVLLYFSDMVLLLSNIWNSLKVTASPLFMGITLSVGTAIPFILKKTRITLLKYTLNVHELYKRRIVVFSLLLIISLLNYSDSPPGFIITSLVIGYLSLITLSTLEASNTKLVLGGHITSEKASRIMQTVVQIGSFFGAMVSGFLLTSIKFNTLIMLICLFDIIVSACGHFLFSEQASTVQDENTTQANHTPVKISKTLKILCISIGLIGLHISAFNTLTPILFQTIKELSAEYFGTCSAVAGAGAFSTAFVNVRIFRYLLPALVLMCCDYIFTTSPVAELSIVACFFIGFSINTIRINTRKHMIDQVKNKREAEEVGSYSAALYTFSQSLGPVLFGILTSNNVLGAASSVLLFPFIGFLLFAYMLIWSVNKGFTRE